MTLTELYAAVMTSPGSLDDETMARIWCLVHRKEYDGYIGETDDNKQLIITYLRSKGGRAADILDPHERPDRNLDAALDLVRVRFPKACPDIWLRENGYWNAGLRINLRGLNPNSCQHKDRRLVIIAALLKAMGA